MIGRGHRVEVEITGIDATGKAWSSAGRRVTSHQKRVSRLKGVYRGLITTVRKMNSVVAAMPIASLAGGTALFASLGKAVYDAGNRINALRNAMLVSTRSMAGASNEIAKLRKMSDELGVNFVATADAYKKFAIAARQAGLEGAKTDKIFRSVAKATAAMGLSAENTRLTLKAFEQMLSKNQVMAEELRGQAGEHLPGIFGMAADAIGVTTAELNKMMDNGELIARDMLPLLADVLDNRFTPAMMRASKQPLASMNRLRNAWDKLLVTIADSGAMGVMGDVIDKVTAKLKDLSENFNEYSLKFVRMLKKWRDEGYQFTIDGKWVVWFRNWAVRFINAVLPIIRTGFAMIKGALWDTFSDVDFGALFAMSMGRSANVIDEEMAQIQKSIDLRQKAITKGGEWLRAANAQMDKARAGNSIEGIEDAQRRIGRLYRLIRTSKEGIVKAQAEMEELKKEHERITKQRAAFTDIPELVPMDFFPVPEGPGLLDTTEENLLENIETGRSEEIYKALVERYRVTLAEAKTQIERDAAAEKIRLAFRFLVDVDDRTAEKALGDALKQLHKIEDTAKLGAAAHKNLLHNIKMINPAYAEMYKKQAKMDEMYNRITKLADKFNWTTEQTVELYGELAKAGEKAADKIKNKWQLMAEGMKDSMSEVITDIGMGVKSLEDGIKDLGAMIQRQIYQKTVADPIAELITGGASSLLGSLSPAPASTSTPWLNPDTGTFVSHTGGIVGKDTPKRFHTGGIAGDEVPAILQKGEMVLTKEQQKAVGNTVVNVTYAPQVAAFDPQTASQTIMANAQTVVGVVRMAFARQGVAAGI